jgi:outer membrane protein
VTRNRLLTPWVLALPLCAFGQIANQDLDLPSAPVPQASAQLWRSSQTGLDRVQPKVSPAPQTAAPVAGQQLSLNDAEALAVRQNPEISVGSLLALASQQVTREARSNLWPTASADLTGVDSQANSRISAGGLNNPIIYERAAGGVTVSQLITDFGRTSNLVASASLAARAEAQNALATKEQILLEVNQAFFNALQAQAVLRVAEQTVTERQVVADQVGALANHKLKSDLDLSFANVNLAQAKLLLLDAQNNKNAALANLSAVLGYSAIQNFVLLEDLEPMATPPANIDALIADALAKRPELLALDFQYQSAQKLKTAEHDLLFPTIRALGTVGGAPIRNDHLSSWYGAVGANMEIPIFNGFLSTARAHEADLRSQAARDRVLALRNRISRDVRTSWLAVNAAHDRLGVAQQLLQQAQLALDLSQARYKLGLGSIVELSQAQLQATQAEIGNAQAGYDYRLALAVLQYQTSGL